MNKRLLSFLFVNSNGTDLYWGHFYDCDWHYYGKHIMRPSVGMGVLWM